MNLHLIILDVLDFICEHSQSLLLFALAALLVMYVWIHIRLASDVEHPQPVYLHITDSMQESTQYNCHGHGLMLATIAY